MVESSQKAYFFYSRKVSLDGSIEPRKRSKFESPSLIGPVTFQPLNGRIESKKVTFREKKLAFFLCRFDLPRVETVDRNESDSVYIPP